MDEITNRYWDQLFNNSGRKDNSEFKLYIKGLKNELIQEVLEKNNNYFNLERKLDAIDKTLGYLSNKGLLYGMKMAVNSGSFLPRQEEIVVYLNDADKDKIKKEFEKISTMLGSAGLKVELGYDPEKRSYNDWLSNVIKFVYLKEKGVELKDINRVFRKKLYDLAEEELLKMNKKDFDYYLQKAKSRVLNAVLENELF